MTEREIIGILGLVAVFVLLMLRIPVGLAMTTVGIGGSYALSVVAPHLRFEPYLRQFKTLLWNTVANYDLSVVPLFVLMGFLAAHANLSRDLFQGVNALLGRLRGGVAMAAVGACAGFGAVCGSSLATASTMGRVALPELKRMRYDGSLATGTLAAGGTLGILIPPSINMIIYAVLTNASVPKLYLAGIVPGIALVLIFMATILLLCLLRPAWGGRTVSATWAARIAGLAHLLPPLGIFLLVVGSIYAGIATPTEAASLGVLGALGLAWWAGRLSIAMLKEAFEGTMKATAMVMLIVVAAYFLNFVISTIGLTTMLTNFIENLGLPKAATLFAVILFYVVLGCFMETLSMMITTIPIIAPVMFKLGYDPVWFGILVILLIETALVTPPVGLNLFVVQNLRAGGSLNDVIVGTAPFVFSLFAMIFVLTAYPDIALWLPRILS
jgi:tripartite ATP-independent transporter DctM subunit